jgi:uncharacterized protein YkuJ
MRLRDTRTRNVITRLLSVLEDSGGRLEQAPYSDNGQSVIALSYYVKPILG